MQLDSTGFAVLVGLLLFSIVSYAKHTKNYRPSYVFRNGSSSTNSLSALIVIVFLLVVILLTRVFDVTLTPKILIALLAATFVVLAISASRYIHMKKKLYDQSKRVK